MTTSGIHPRWPAVALCLLLLAIPAPALGHAQMITTSPSDEALLTEAPTEVSVRFDEPVTAPPEAIRVFTAGGRRVDSGAVRSSPDGTVLTISLHPLDRGTHVASWRAVSGDGHPVGGAFIFHVEEQTAQVDSDLVARLIADSGGRPNIASTLTRWVALGSALVAMGVFVFSRVMPATSPLLGGVLRRVSLIGGVAALAQVPAFVVDLGGPSGLGSSPVWAETLSSGVAVAALARVVGLGMVALGGPLTGWAGVALLAVAGLATGHARTVEPALVMWVGSAVHVLGAGVWLGGLVALAVVLRKDPPEGDPAHAATAISRFSLLAAGSIVLLALAGGAMAWATVRAPEALGTTYGWLLIAKTSLLVLALGIAYYNSRFLAPAVRAGGGDQSTATRLRRTVRAEVAVLILVVGVTAFLAGTQPSAEAAGVLAPSSAVARFGDHLVEVVVDPGRAGDNEIHVSFISPVGRAVAVTGAVTLEMSMPARELGPLVRTPQFVGPGHYLHQGSELTISGVWEITVRLGVSEFAEESATLRLGVRR